MFTLRFKKSANIAVKHIYTSSKKTNPDARTLMAVLSLLVLSVRICGIFGSLYIFLILCFKNILSATRIAFNQGSELYVNPTPVEC